MNLFAKRRRFSDLRNLSHAGHWGGANDGVPQDKLTLDTALLIDSARRKTSGRVYFASLAALY